MARLFSFLLLIAFASAALGQAFGRFGYSDQPSVPGFAVDQGGFAAKQARADRLEFLTRSQRWQITSVSPQEMNLLLDRRAGSPQKLRLHLTAPGISLYFPQGIRLKLSSTAAPYLTWLEGSVSNGVPTPPSKWLILSFRDQQPPIVLGFPDNPVSLEIGGKPGAWVLRSPLEYDGWVRVGLPVGLTAVAANTAAAMGKLAQTAATQEFEWTHRAPALTSQKLEADLNSVTCTWSFDEPGAIVPRAASFADLGGYPIALLSESKRLSADLEQGPVDVLSGTELKIRFPCKRVPMGRALGQGSTNAQPLGTASPLDIPSVVGLAFEALTGTRDLLSAKAAEDTLGEFLAQASYVKEPLTGQQLPYAMDGKDLDLAAAHALLMQAITSTSKPKSEANSLLTSVVWRLDWMSWLPAVADSAVARRGAALCALAGALCPEKDRRLAAALFQAGLAGERGYQTWRRRKGYITAEQPLLEPVLGIRQAIFSLRGRQVEGNAFGQLLLSPLRAFSDGPISFEGDQLKWPALEPKPAKMTLAAGFPIQLSPSANLSKLVLDGALGLYEIRYTPETAGTCQAKLTFGSLTTAIPAAVAPPAYSEPLLGPGQR